jgi:hypothetical protein
LSQYNITVLPPWSEHEYNGGWAVHSNTVMEAFSQ